MCISKEKDFSALHQPNSTLSYDVQLLHFTRLRTASAFLLLDSSKIDIKISLQILFAMLHRRPVIIADTPTFQSGVDLFSRNLIESKLSKIYICDLNKLDDKDFDIFTKNVINQPINYVLTKHEAELIKARLRAHFRGLLEN